MIQPRPSVRRGTIPAGVPRANDGHPARDRLIAAYVFNSQQPYDLIGGLGRTTIVDGTPEIRSGPAGSFVNFAYSRLQAQSTVSGDVTVVMLGVRNASVTATYTPGAVGSMVNSGANNGFEIAWGNAWGNPNGFHCTINQAVAADAAWIDGVKQSSTNPCDVTITNGQWYGVAVRMTGVNANSPITFGGRGSGELFYVADGGLALCLVYEGVLPDETMADLSVDPASALIWPEDDLLGSLVHIVPPTITEKTIGTGGDYATIAAWLAACPANLITSNVIWRGKLKNQVFTENVSISGHTTDSLHYIELTTDAGASFRDHANARTNPLRYNESVGAAIRGTLYMGDAYTRVSNIQLFYNASTMGWAGEMFAIDGRASVFENFIVEGVNIGNVMGLYGPGFIHVRNGLVVQRSSGATVIRCASTYGGGDVIYLTNLTIARPTDFSTTTAAIFSDWHYVQIFNCLVLNGGGTFSNGGLENGDYNATDLASIGFGSVNLTSLSAASVFENPSAASGTHDFRLKAGASPIDAGTDRGLAADIVGYARGALVDIGAWEFGVASALSVPPGVFGADAVRAGWFGLDVGANGWFSKELFTAPAAPSGPLPVTGTGAFSLMALVLASIASIRLTGAGSTTLQRQAPAGSGTTPATGAGATTLQGQAPAGVASTPATGTGAPAVASDVVAGVASAPTTATGAPAVEKVAVSGAATVTALGDVTAAGAVIMDPVRVSGAGTTPTTGAGAPQLAPDLVAGASSTPATGTGGTTLRPETVAGTGSAPATGQGAATVAKESVAGVASAPATGTGAPAVERVAIAGTGTVAAGGNITAIGAFVLDPVKVAGIGVIAVTGAGGLTHRAAVQSAGIVTVGAAGAFAVAPLGAIATGLARVAGAGVMSTDPVALAAGAAIRVAGVGAADLQAMVVASSGASTVSAAAVVPWAADISGAGLVNVTGGGAMFLGPVRCAGYADIRYPFTRYGNLAVANVGRLAVVPAGVDTAHAGAPGATLVVPSSARTAPVGGGRARRP